MSTSTMAAEANEDRIEVAPPQRSSTAVCLKRLVQGCFLVLCLPRLMLYRIASVMMGSRAFHASSESIAHMPGNRGVYLRQQFYRHTLSRCGQDIYFGWMSVFSMTEASVGDRVYIGRFCSIGFADIGPEVMLADGVQILSGGDEHAHGEETEAMQSAPQTYRKVTVGAGAWIGAGAIVMADVGERAIVGAGAVVTKPIPAGCTAVGVPSQVIKYPSEQSS